MPAVNPQRKGTVVSKTKPPKAKPKASPKKQDKSFFFRDIVTVIKYTGFKASNIKELRYCIAKASDDAIFHHTCQYFLKGNTQEHTNDFAQWAFASLEESALAEQLSNVDPYSFRSMRTLKAHFLKIIDLYIEELKHERNAHAGEEFHLNDAVTYVFPSGMKSRNLAEFLMAIKYIASSSIYYHFYESLARLRKGDDFSKWIDEVMKSALIAESLRAIDPFMNDLESIREKIISILDEGIRKEMEVME